MKRPSNPFENWSSKDRFETAKQRVSQLIDNLLQLLHIHETNRIIVFSDRLSSQIPTSHAASAFNIFTDSLYRHEVIRLATFWDKAARDRISIPTIRALVDHPSVEELLGEDAYRSAADPGHWMGDGIDETIRDILERSAIERAARERAKCRIDLAALIDEIQAFADSPKLGGLQAYRNAHFAHSLVPDEHQTAAMAVTRYGHEKEVFDETVKMVLKLHQTINLTHFTFDRSREMARLAAKELWENCTFQIPDRRRQS